MHFSAQKVKNGYILTDHEEPNDQEELIIFTKDSQLLNWIKEQMKKNSEGADGS